MPDQMPPNCRVFAVATARGAGYAERVTGDDAEEAVRQEAPRRSAPEK